MRNFLPKTRHKSGTSLIEVLIAVSVFIVVTLIASQVMLQTIRTSKKISIQTAVYGDMRTILAQLTSEIQNGTIDYEEYYSVCVVQESCDWPMPSTNTYYGAYNGVYGGRFFDPGLDETGTPVSNPNGLGVICSYPAPLGSAECQIIHSLSSDTNTGQNPFAGSNFASGGMAGSINAFCDGIAATQGLCGSVTNVGGRHDGNDNDGTRALVDELYLVDATGTKKTIIGKKLLEGTDYVLGKVVMNGTDEDQNGIVETFSCDGNYACDNTAADIADVIMYADAIDATAYPTPESFIVDKGITMPRLDDLDDAFISGEAIQPSHFVPISPLRSSIESLQFVISPVDDPFKAFGESAMQAHPTITVILTLDLSDTEKENYPGTFEPITVQTTVTSGVFNRIDTYPSISQIYGEAGDPPSSHWSTGINVPLSSL